MIINTNMSKYSIISLDEVSSTNSYAMEHFQFFDDKSVIYTTRQKSGRGRYNRKWIGDESDNLYISIILKPENYIYYPFSNVTQYLSVVVCRLLEKEFDLAPKIKWPNDILIDGCKISGILAEAHTEQNVIKGIVLGLGLNVNLPPQTLDKIDQKAVSLYVLKNKNYNVEDILEKLLIYFFKDYSNFEKEKFLYIKDEYIKRCDFIGKEITIKEADMKKTYTALSVDDEGLLIVKNKQEEEIQIITGDILCTQI